MATAKAKVQAPASRLGAVTRGKLQQPLRFLFYGVEGVGKSTLAASAPDSIILDIEGGSGELDTARYPFRDDAAGHIPVTVQEVYDAIEDLRTAEHDYKHVAIDTVDALEALIWARVVDTYSGVKGTVNKSGRKLDSIADIGYGKGYEAAVDEWRCLLFQLDRLRMERGMSIILLGHASIAKFANPIGDDYDRIALRLHKHASGVVKEWCEVVGYCAHEGGVAKMGEGDKPQPYSTGLRLMHLEHSLSWDAKTRIPMPARLVLDEGDPWAPFAAEIARGRDTSAKELLSLISVELKRLDDEELTANVRAACKKAGENTAALSRYLNNLKER